MGVWWGDALWVSFWTPTGRLDTSRTPLPPSLPPRPSSPSPSMFSGFEMNFIKSRSSNMLVPYDYSSVMHYGRWGPLLASSPPRSCQPSLDSGPASGFQARLQPARATHHHPTLGPRCPHWPALEPQQLGHRTGPQVLWLRPKWPRAQWARWVTGSRAIRGAGRRLLCWGGISEGQVLRGESVGGEQGQTRGSPFRCRKSTWKKLTLSYN